MAKIFDEIIKIGIPRDLCVLVCNYYHSSDVWTMFFNKKMTEPCQLVFEYSYDPRYLFLQFLQESRLLFLSFTPSGYNCEIFIQSLAVQPLLVYTNPIIVTTALIGNVKFTCRNFDRFWKSLLHCQFSKACIFGRNYHTFERDLINHFVF